MVVAALRWVAWVRGLSGVIPSVGSINIGYVSIYRPQRPGTSRV